MVVYWILHNLRTSRLSLSASALPNPSHTFPPILLSLLLFPPFRAILASVPNFPPTASLRGIFAPGGYFLYIHCTFFSLPSLHAAPLPSLATLLYLDSPIGRVPLPHIPNTLLAVLLPRKGMPLLLLPSSCTFHLARTQTYCPHFPISSFSLPKSPSTCSGGPSGQTTHIFDTCGHPSFLSSS